MKLRLSYLKLCGDIFVRIIVKQHLNTFNRVMTYPLTPAALRRESLYGYRFFCLEEKLISKAFLSILREHNPG